MGLSLWWASFPPSRIRWSKVLIALGVLALSFWLGPWFGGNAIGKAEPWILLSLVAFAFVMLTHLDWSILLLVVGAVTPPIGIGTGTLSDINPAMLLVVAVTAAWLMRMLLVEKRIHWVPATANRPLVGLLVAASLSMLSVQLFRGIDIVLPPNYLQVQLGGLSLVLLSAMAFWLGANVIRGIRWLKYIVALMIVLGALAILNAGLPVLLPNLSLVYLFPGVHGLYWMWAPALAYGQILFNRTLRFEVKGFLWVSILAWIWWAWVQVGTFIAPLVALFVAMTIITWVRSPRVAAFGIGLFLISLPIFRDEYYQRFFVVKVGSYNRPDIWLSMLGAFGSKQPIVGLGPATYSWYAMANGFAFRQSHSQYVDLFLQFGIIGLVCFVIFFVSAIWEAWRLRHYWQGLFENGFVVSVLGCLCGALAGSVLADWVLPQVYNVGLNGFRHTMFTWFLAGSVMALRQIHARQAPLNGDGKLEVAAHAA